MNRAEQMDALVKGAHGDPFGLLGPHAAAKSWTAAAARAQRLYRYLRDLHGLGDTTETT